MSLMDGIRRRPWITALVTGAVLLSVTGPVAFGLARGVAYHLRVTGWGGGPAQLWFGVGTCCGATRPC